MTTPTGLMYRTTTLV